MVIDYINKELNKYYSLFVIYLVILALAWGILLFERNLLIIPIIISAVIEYLVVKKAPEYNYWNKILKHYKANEIEKFIEDEYSLMKNKKEYKEETKTKKSINATRMNVQYQTRKDIYDSSKKLNKTKILLELNKFIEEEKKMKN